MFNDLESCNFIFISVPTPFDFVEDKIIDSSVHESLEKLVQLNYKGIVLIKSTLPVGSCKLYHEKYDLQIAYNPEFLRESTTPNEDFKNQECIVIGSPDKIIFNSIKEMYKPVTSSKVVYHHLSFQEAEMVKYAQNTMLASRVALANMIFDACEEYHIKYDLIRKIAFDSFDILGPNMVQVPGPDGKRGFGGKCLPKDTRGFSKIFKSNLLEEVIRYNSTLRDDKV